MVKKQIKKTLRGSKVGQRKVVRRKPVKAARPARKGGLSFKVVSALSNGLKAIDGSHSKLRGKLLYGVRHQDAVDRVVLEHREREKRADIQEMRVALGVA